jgi:hypothetical protein
MTSPLGQITGVPAAQSTMSHPSVPASAAGQWTTQAAPAAQLVWHGDAEQVNVQVLSVSQTHCPFAHVPEQLLFGSHVTWQGGVWQAKSQELSLPQVHVPFAHIAWQLLLLPLQVAWQGGAVQTNRQSSPDGQVQVPLLQPTTTGLQAVASTSARTAKRPAPQRMLIWRLCAWPGKSLADVTEASASEVRGAHSPSVLHAPPSRREGSLCRGRGRPGRRILVPATR